jgi:hypothetical protein
MRFPRPRFTVRWMMIVVVVVAVALKLESSLWFFASSQVRSGPDDYIWEEAVAAWIILSSVVWIPLGLFIVAWRSNAGKRVK